jgi:L-fuconate dehydratase
VSGRYQAPEAAGFSAEMRPEALSHYCYPDGPAWRGP